MSVLTRPELLGALEEGRIGIDPFDPDQVGPASVDLRLSNQFRVFTEHHKVFALTEAADYESVTRRIEVDDALLLMPGQSVLGITRERIRLAPDLCGWLEGRSRFARVGLTVHSTSGFVQPGVDNCQVLEISNTAPIPLQVYPDTKVCQIIVEETRGEAHYEGRFRDQTQP